MEPVCVQDDPAVEYDGNIFHATFHSRPVRLVERVSKFIPPPGRNDKPHIPSGQPPDFGEERLVGGGRTGVADNKNFHRASW